MKTITIKCLGRDFGLIIEEDDTMSLEESKAVVRKVIKTLNNRDLVLLDEFVAPDFVDHTHRTKGLKEYKQYIAMVRKGFPDYNETIEDIIAEGDKVWVRYKFMGTHTGEYRGLTPTGKKVTFTAVAVWRIVKGKIVEKESALYNILDFYKQLGIIEYTEKGKELFPDG
jgi:predicted ester cyclase